MKKFKTILIFTIICSFMLLPVFSQGRDTEKRVALVIGNEKYKEKPLKNPVNDANAIKEKLEELNFDVIKVTNLDQNEMKNYLRKFYEAADKADIALFYYAGHGIEYGGNNYLLPVKETFEDNENSFEDSAINLQTVITRIEATNCSRYIAIIDACREYPVKKARGGSSRGITTVSTLNSCEGIIFYSCASGSWAYDGEGKSHSPFAQALLDHITQNVSFTKIVQEVTKDVKNVTENEQTPYKTDSLTTDIFLNGKPESVVPLEEKIRPDNIRPDNLKPANSAKVSVILFVVFFIAMIICFIVFTAKGQKVFAVVKNQTVNLKNQASDFTIRTVSNIKEKAKTKQEIQKEKEESVPVSVPDVQTPSYYLDSVLVDKSFYCAVSPVTVLQYKEVSGRTDYDQDAQENEPVTNISYFEAAQFMNALSNKDKLECVYDLSNPQDIKINKAKNGWRLPDEAEWKKAAGNKQISDMLGLVWQWCNDSKKNKYVLKGGSWDCPKKLINTSSRMMVVKEFKSDAVGMIGVRNK